MFSAVLDANVLYPLHFRDLLLYANLNGRPLYAPIWSDEILDEMGRNLVANRKVSPENVDRLIAGMKRTYPEAMHNPPSRLSEAMTNDPGDRHVLATAIHAGSEVIVSKNGKHFPPESLAPYGIEVQSTDEFLLNLLSLSEPTMARAVCFLLERYKRPAYSIEQLLGIYASEAPGFADAIAQLI